MRLDVAEKGERSVGPKTRLFIGPERERAKLFVEARLRSWCLKGRKSEKRVVIGNASNAFAGRVACAGKDKTG